MVRSLASYHHTFVPAVLLQGRLEKCEGGLITSGCKFMEFSDNPLICFKVISGE
jgi:hypothetical protein